MFDVGFQCTLVHCTEYSTAIFIKEEHPPSIVSIEYRVQKWDKL